MSYLDEDKTLTWRQWLGIEPLDTGPQLVWWRPPFKLVIRQMTWWWALLPTFLLGLGLVIAALFPGEFRAAFCWLGMKTLVLTLAVPVLAWGHLRQRAIQARTDDFCSHCGWTLQGLPEEGRCPECGRPYRIKIVRMFRRDPQWVIAYWQSSGKPPPQDVFEKHHPDGYPI